MEKAHFITLQILMINEPPLNIEQFKFVVENEYKINIIFYQWHKSINILTTWRPNRWKDSLWPPFEYDYWLFTIEKKKL